ncbi:MAG: DUF2024 family protein [Gammaproteobacteria bacterium]
MPVSHVYDTYAKTAQGRIMHFDVIIDEMDSDKALECAKKWLKSIGVDDASLDARQCTFCHSAEAPSEIRRQIESQGYGIFKLEGCPT